MPAEAARRRQRDENRDGQQSRACRRSERAPLRRFLQISSRRRRRRRLPFFHRRIYTQPAGELANAETPLRSVQAGKDQEGEDVLRKGP